MLKIVYFESILGDFDSNTCLNLYVFDDYAIFFSVKIVFLELGLWFLATNFVLFRYIL